MNIRIEKVESQAAYERTLDVRREVFVYEQNVSEAEEVDPFTEDQIVYLLWLDDKPVATGRLRVKDSILKFERIATLKAFRGQGLAQQIMQALEKEGFQKFPHHLGVLNAQLSALGFYEKLLWQSFGEIFEEANIAHRSMYKLNPAHKDPKHLQIWGCCSKLASELRSKLPSEWGRQQAR